MNNTQDRTMEFYRLSLEAIAIVAVFAVVLAIYWVQNWEVKDE